MTRGQRNAIDAYWPQFGVQLDELRQIASIYHRQAPLTVEIGFGMGDSLLTMAVADPGRNYLGIEVHWPGIGHLLQGIQKESLDNLRLVHADSVDVLQGMPAESVDLLQVFFPDPWPKKKHRKRRLINEGFLNLAAVVLAPAGRLHIATDWLDYAEEIGSLLKRHPSFLATDAPVRPETKYEKRGIGLGHSVFDMAQIRR